MKTVIMYNAFEDKEEKVELESFTGLKIGTRVSRTAENIRDILNTPSSFVTAIRKDTAKLWATGTLLDLDYAGFCQMRGNLVTAKVQWDNGEVFSCVTGYLESIK